jgi:trimeric autotransporter adhesin
MRLFRIGITVPAQLRVSYKRVALALAAAAVLAAIQFLPVESANAQNWSLTGNAGTVAGFNFVGTTDLSPLTIKVHGRRVIRLEPALGNVSGDFGPNVVEGDRLNSVKSGVQGATIGGGGGLSSGKSSPNTVQADFGTVGGGLQNTARGVFSTLGGGFGNIAGGASTVAGGQGNVASDFDSTVGGGISNTASGSQSTVSGGDHNTAGSANTPGGGHHSTVGGGQDNTASGDFSTVPGGEGNTASGSRSFAAGFEAQAVCDGAFVWADDNPFPFFCANSNGFNVRSTNGARFVSAIDGSGNPTAGVFLAPGGGSWGTFSDRGMKENFAPVNADELLRRLVRVPIDTWNYKAQPRTIRHIGPTAQDFRAAFSVGEDDRHITTVDADGVALAAIQGLYAMLQEKDAEIRALRRQQMATAAQIEEINVLKARLDSLEQRSEPRRASAR